MPVGVAEKRQTERRHVQTEHDDSDEPKDRCAHAVLNIQEPGHCRDGHFTHSITGLGLEGRAARRAVVEVHAGVGWHGFRFLVARAGKAGPSLTCRAALLKKGRGGKGCEPTCGRAGAENALPRPQIADPRPWLPEPATSRPSTSTSLPVPRPSVRKPVTSRADTATPFPCTAPRCQIRGRCCPIHRRRSAARVRGYTNRARRASIRRHRGARRLRRRAFRRRRCVTEGVARQCAPVVSQCMDTIGLTRTRL